MIRLHFLREFLCNELLAKCQMCLAPGQLSEVPLPLILLWAFQSTVWESWPWPWSWSSLSPHFQSPIQGQKNHVLPAFPRSRPEGGVRRKRAEFIYIFPGGQRGRVTVQGPPASPRPGGQPRCPVPYLVPEAERMNVAHGQGLRARVLELGGRGVDPGWCVNWAEELLSSHVKWD